MCMTEQTCFPHDTFQRWDIFSFRFRGCFPSVLTKPIKPWFLYCFRQLVDKHWLVLLQIAWNGNWVYQKTHSNGKWKNKQTNKQTQKQGTTWGYRYYFSTINSESSLNWASGLFYPHPAGLRQIFRANHMVLHGNPPFITCQICALGHLPDVWVTCSYEPDSWTPSFCSPKESQKFPSLFNFDNYEQIGQ